MTKIKLSLSGVQQLCIYYLIAWLISPPLAYGAIFRIIAVLATIIWLFIQLISSKPKVTNASNNSNIFLFCSLFYAIILLCTRIIYHNMGLLEAINYDITTYILIGIGYIASNYIKSNRIEEIKKVFYFSLILAVIFSLTTILRNPSYTLLTRSAGGETTEAYNSLARQAALHGVGGFGFTCFVSTLSPLILYVSMGLKKNYFYIIIFAILEIEVISAGYALALIISVVGIVIAIQLNTKNIAIRFVTIIIGLFIIIFWSSISEQLYYALKSLSSGSMYANKVEDVFSFLIEGTSEGSFYGRQVRYQKSIDSILNYPIFGSYLLAGKRVVGYHSSILDTFAAYGLLPGLAWIYIIIGFPVNESKDLYNNKGLGILEGLLLFATAFFNTYTMHMSVFYFIFPAVATIIYKLHADEKNEKTI